MPGLACVNCGCGKTPHFGDDDGCWGRHCIDKPTEERCRSWHPTTHEKAAKVERLAQVIPITAPDMWERRQPKEGSMAERIHAEIQSSPEGLTCDEVEQRLNEPHQSASAAVNWLMRHGWIEDSGRRRNTRYGREATVWLDRDRDQISLPGLPG